MRSLSGVSWKARWVLGLALAGAALSWASVAEASQRSSDAQYPLLTAESGPAAGLSCSRLDLGNDDGLFGAGDRAVFPGGFSISSGASVILDDMDGTQGTFIDGQNATITGSSSLTVEATGDPIGASGGDGVLSDTVCNSIVATSGISGAGASGADASEAGASSADASGADASETGASEEGRSSILGVLPDTGGTSLFALLAGLAALGTGLVFVQRLHARR